MQSIIFLDIDGVINTRDGLDYSLRYRGEIHDESGLNYFCPKSCEYISKLIEHYDASIVLYSHWANKFKNIDETKKFFKSRGLNWQIIDKTSKSLINWMIDNGIPEKYIIITSDKSLLKFFPNQIILTEEIHGFADRKLYRKAMKILKRPAEIKIELIKKNDKKLF